MRDQHLMPLEFAIHKMTGLPAGRRDVFGIDDIRFAALSVPEPSALALAAATVGLGVAGFFARKRLGRPRHG